MMPRAPFFLALGLLLLIARSHPRDDTPVSSPSPPAPPSPPATASIREEQRKLREALITEDAAALAAWLQRHTPPDADWHRAQTWIRQLGDESQEVRDQAQQDLLGLGAAVLGLIAPARRDPDPEVAARAIRCWEAVAATVSPEAILQAIRLVILKKPANFLAILLGYLPYAPDETSAKEIHTALGDAVGASGHLDEVRQALKDATPPRRLAAATALCQAGRQELLGLVLPLLDDPQLALRASVARQLAERKISLAIPVLIDLLDQVEGSDFWPIEDLLLRLAGDQAPDASPGADGEQRRIYRNAWATWWKTRSGQVDWQRFERSARQEGKTLVVELDLRTLSGGVVEWLPSQEVACRIDDLDYPMSAQWLGDDRLLIAHYKDARVCERNRKGEILWEVKVGSPVLFAQRLPNGHTFLACRNRLLEWDADGKEVFVYRRPVRDIVAARKHASGEMAVLTQDGDCFILDAEGKEMHRFAIGSSLVLGAGIDWLPNRRLVIPLHGDNRVIECDRHGHVVWEAHVRQPSAAVRLPNGRTLVTSTTTRRIIELDRSGEVVWEMKTELAPLQASRR